MKAAKGNEPSPAKLNGGASLFWQQVLAPSYAKVAWAFLLVWVLLEPILLEPWQLKLYST